MNILKYLLISSLVHLSIISPNWASDNDDQDKRGTKRSLNFNAEHLESQQLQRKKPAITSILQGPWGVNTQQVDKAFEDSQHLVCIIEFGKCFRRLNIKWQEVLGWEIEELVNVPYHGLVHPEDLAKTQDYEKNFLPTGFTNRYRCKDGSYRWLSWIGLTKLNGSNTDPSLGIAVDVTFDILMKEQHEHRINVLNEHMNFQSRIMKSVAEIQQLYLGELGRYSHEENPKLFFPRIIQHFITLTESELGFIAHIQQEHNHNTVIDQAWQFNPSLDATQQQLYTTRWREPQWAARFQALIDKAVSQPQGLNIVAKDMQQNKDVRSMITATYFSSFLGIPLLSNNKVLGVLALANRDQGYNAELQEWLSPLFTLTASIVKEAHFSYYRQQADQRLITEKSATKTSFLTYMSHELRTPLSSLISLLDLIPKEKLDQESIGYLQTAQTEGQSLLNILNDMLDLSKIEGKEIILSPSPLNLLQLTQEVIKQLYPSASDKENVLRLIVDPKVPEMVLGDTLRWRQILMNLIGNAIKFTQQGSIDVGLDGQVLDENGSTPIFALVGTVKDTGVGIGVDQQQLLFKPFAQADDTMTRKFGGTGLGLYITKHLCELMGGSVCMYSTLGQGTTVTFNLKFPLTISPTNSSKPLVATDKKPLLGLRVLVAEDHPVNQKVLKVLLEKLGHQVSLVANGLEALHAVKSDKYDLVLMDGSMPEMDGLEATRQIRLLPAGNTIPIIAVTAHNLASDKARFLQSGMNGYLAKPVRKESLQAEIKRCLNL